MSDIKPKFPHGLALGDRVAMTLTERRKRWQFWKPREQLVTREYVITAQVLTIPNPILTAYGIE